jgi:hypothetical protein
LQKFIIIKCDMIRVWMILILFKNDVSTSYDMQFPILVTAVRKELGTFDTKLEL